MRFSCRFFTLIVTLFLAQARAATFSVTNANDSGSGSLSQAITDANNNAGDDVIVFDLPGAGPHLISLANPLPNLVSNISIINDRPGDEPVTLQKSDTSAIQFPIFDTSSQFSHIILLAGLTISKGQNSNGGGGIFNPGGDLTLRNCTLSNNNGTTGGGGGIKCYGTGIPAKLTLLNCTLTNNNANVAGGGIYITAFSSATTEVNLSNCTLSGHTSGAIQIDNNTGGSVKVTMTNCTLADNRGVNSSHASDLGINGGTVEVRNSIFAHQAGGGANIITSNSGVITSLGHNISDDAAGGDNSTTAGGLLNGASDKRNTNPRLGSLADNGGLTATQALLTNSPAIDSGDDAGAPLTDQRGYYRAGVSDIGAFEFGGTATPGSTPTPTPTATPSPTPKPTPNPTLTVTNTNDAGAGSLREAINQANAATGNDSIVFELPGGGTRIIELSAALPTLSSNIEILNDRNGDRPVTVQRSGGSKFPIFVTAPGVTALLSGLTISNGDVSGGFPISSGGGIRNDHATLTLRKCNVTGNSASSGGGLANDGSKSGAANLILIDCTVNGNSGSNAGAIANDGGSGGNASLFLVRCTLTSNAGGAVLNEATSSGVAKATLTGSVLSNNTGTAAWNISDGTGEADMVAQACLLNNNTSTGGAAGIANYKVGPNSVATLTASNCTISGNQAGSAAGSGGAGLNNSEGTMTLTSCTVNGNASADKGGGIENVRGHLTLTNCTFAGNSSALEMGGALFSSGPLALTNCSLSENGAVSFWNEATTADIRNSIFRRQAGGENIRNNSGTVTSHGHNISDDAAGGDSGTAPGGFLNAAGDVRNTDPQFDPAGLKSNGGPTSTIGLLGTSPAINTGDDTTAPARDQRGFTRRGASDIGAFERDGAAPLPRLGNISTRLSVGAGDNALIGGFIVSGTEPKRVIVRAIGPSLPVAGVLADTHLDLYKGDQLIASNDDWRSDQQAEIIASTVPPPNDFESAVVSTLPANNTGYTVIVRGVNNATGAGLVEVYDLDPHTDSMLANISSRGLVQTGDNIMIGGFIIVGNAPQKVIVRAIGPSLPVTGKLGDPTLDLIDANGVTVGTNDNWRSDQEAEIIASTIPPANDLEAAMVRTLTPAAYTAVVRGKNGTTGVALVEVYSLD